MIVLEYELCKIDTTERSQSADKWFIKYPCAKPGLPYDAASVAFPTM